MLHYVRFLRNDGHNSEKIDIFFIFMVFQHVFISFQYKQNDRLEKVRILFNTLTPESLIKLLIGNIFFGKCF